MGGTCSAHGFGDAWYLMSAEKPEGQRLLGRAKSERSLWNSTEE